MLAFLIRITVVDHQIVSPAARSLFYSLDAQSRSRAERRLWKLSNFYSFWKLICTLISNWIAFDIELIHSRFSSDEAAFLHGVFSCCDRPRLPELYQPTLLVTQHVLWGF